LDLIAAMTGWSWHYGGVVFENGMAAREQMIEVIKAHRSGGERLLNGARLIILARPRPRDFLVRQNQHRDVGLILVYNDHRN